MSRADDFWLGRNYEVKGVGAVRRAGDISLYTSANPIRSVTFGREIKRYNRNTHAPDLTIAVSFSAIAKTRQSSYTRKERKFQLASAHARSHKNNAVTGEYTR